uniref:Uncharacterized protein n=1 Tax=Arundo donax TaxID=35708 RepID=A0A0A8ZHM9_ARUDO
MISSVLSYEMCCNPVLDCVRTSIVDSMCFGVSLMVELLRITMFM